MSDTPVTLSMVGPVALVSIDDGKVNALTPDLLDSLFGLLDAAEANAGAVVLAGRPGVFCAGLDLNVMRGGGPAVKDLLRKGGEIFLRLAEFPRPIVAACTGHALAAGAVVLLCCDIRICAAGTYKVGLNEVAIGLPLPPIVVALARARLSPRHFTRACNTAQVYSPAEAVEVGFLDQADSTDATGEALRVATELAEGLNADAFATTRRLTCEGLAETITPN
ncbi:MAG: crotonase/enoyl-CoA hydratase family protein [Acidimicrobiia bacterium]|nr:crotonase/enoyl-CoA hydratase family protein [Acidimicrobiia bacterium]